MEDEGNGDTNCNWWTQNNLQMIGKGNGRLRNKRSEDLSDYSIIKISQNTEKSHGDMRLEKFSKEKIMIISIKL